jgi:phage terminase Nu1 subunit (DNA packaging protein)
MPLVTEQPPLDTTPLMTAADICRVFKISESTLRLWRSRGLPMVGGRHTHPRYRLHDVMKWVEGRD